MTVPDTRHCYLERVLCAGGNLTDVYKVVAFAIAISCLFAIGLTASAASAEAATPKRVHGDIWLGGPAFRGFEANVLFDTKPVPTAILIIDKYPSENFYVTRKVKIKANRVVAKFGSLGKVDLRFHLKTSRAWGDYPLYDECSGKLGKSRLGRWTGKVTFRGEGGFLEAKQRYVKRNRNAWGTRILNSGIKCEPWEMTVPEPDPNLSHVELYATSSDTAVAASSFSAIGSYADLVAAQRERIGYVDVYRTIDGTTLSWGAFRFDETLDNMEILGSRRITGTATFAAGADPEWSGNLRANFLGRPRTELTGSQFTVHRGQYGHVRPADPIIPHVGSLFVNDRYLPFTPSGACLEAC